MVEQDGGTRWWNKMMEQNDETGSWRSKMVEQDGGTRWRSKLERMINKLSSERMHITGRKTWKLRTGYRPGGATSLDAIHTRCMQELIDCRSGCLEGRCAGSADKS